jgi:hypothetical protein
VLPRDVSRNLTLEGGGTMERDSVDWRKSTYSGNNGGQCVEVGNAVSGVVVRDTADRAGGRGAGGLRWRVAGAAG